jgi:hypothetical protein
VVFDSLRVSDIASEFTDRVPSKSVFLESFNGLGTLGFYPDLWTPRKIDWF